LLRQEGEAAWYCPNVENCAPQIKGKIEHFIGRKAMNIDSLGEGKVEILFDQELVRTPADLYKLTPEMLLGLSKTIKDPETGKEKVIRFREKTVENIMAGLELSLQTPFERVLFALGIRYVGETVAKKLARFFGDMDTLMYANEAQLLEVDEIGERIAASLLTYFADPKNRELIEALKQSGLKMKAEVIEKNVLSQKLAGMKILVSGVFEQFSRDQIKEVIESHGGENVSSVSAKTNLIIAGQNMGPAKLEKAEKLGIKIMNEEDFLHLISN
jgi:DNA ligase (NAD+)